MFPSCFRILAEAINTKILTKNHPDSLIPTLIFLIPITPLIQFLDSPFQLLHLALKKVSYFFT